MTALLLDGRDPVVGITIVIPTFNRAEPLRETLSAFTAIDYSGIECEIVVIDNNSADTSDATAAVVKSFQECLPIRYLRETRAGKNVALNKALRECRLKDIVVFTDDDVTPDKKWLQQITCVSARWPNVAVFGGAVEVQWPSIGQPEWAGADWIQALGYSRHDLGDTETFYQALACPFGPNFWVRRDVFDSALKFDENLGPRPSNRLMGGETAFLLRLRSLGYQALYTPFARVKHRIQAPECRIPALRRRGYRLGRAQVRLHGWTWSQRYRSKALWATAMIADYFYTSGRLLWGLMQRSQRANCEITVKAMIRFGRLNEALAILWSKS